jgi:hypothetical protein
MPEAAAPRVDLTPDTEPTYSIPPPPVPQSPRPANSEVKVSVSGPLSQVVNSMGRLNNGNETSGVHRRNLSGVQFLSDLVNNHDCIGFILEISRTGPPSYEGEMLPVGVIDRVQPLTYPELYERIRQIHGGGEYRVRVMDDRGSCVNQLPFRIDTIVDPPKVKIGGSFVVPGSGNPHGAHAYRPVPLTQAAAEEDEVLKLRGEERKVAAEMSVKVKKREMETTERRWRAEEEAELERKEKMQLAPVQQMQNQVQTLERTMLAMQQASQQQQAQMMQSFQQMLMASAQKPQDNSMINLIIESGKQQTQMMITLLTAMMSNGGAKQHEHAEAAKIQAEANKQIMDMAVRSAQGGNSRYDKLIESIVASQVNRPRESIKDALDLMDRGRQQALEMVEMRKNDEDDLEYDPKVGVMGNVGKLIFGLLGGLMKGSGGMQGIASVMAALGKQDASQVKTSELKNLAILLEQQMIQQRAALPAPPQPGAGRPAFGPPTAPVQMPMQQNQPQQPWNRVDVVAPQTQQVVRPVQIRLHPAIEGIYEEEAVQIQVQVPAPQVPVPVMPIVIDDEGEENLPQGEEERLRYFVTEAMRMALEDVKAGVRAHEWSGYALDKWNKSFLDSLVQCPDAAARIDLIHARTDPAVFQQLYAKLVDEKSPQNYANFLRALDELVLEHAQESNLTVAQPVNA